MKTPLLWLLWLLWLFLLLQSALLVTFFHLPTQGFFMKPSSFLLSTTVLSTLAASALALPPPPPAVDVPNKSLHREMHDDMRKEIQEAMKARWEKADTDKDGSINKAEAQAANMSILLKNFDAVDSNKDGKTSEAEAKAWMKSQMSEQGKDYKEHGRKHGEPHGELHNDAHADRYHGMGFKSPEQRREQAELATK
jgi:hypothetical protein